MIYFALIYVLLSIGVMFAVDIRFNMCKRANKIRYLLYMIFHGLFYPVVLFCVLYMKSLSILSDEAYKIRKIK